MFAADRLLTNYFGLLDWVDQFFNLLRRRS